MHAEAQKKHPNETGGVLMGYWDAARTGVVIKKTIGPGPHALHGRTFFSPDSNYHESQISVIYEKSGYRWTYLGDWHVHPNASTNMSSADRKTLKNIALYKPARAPQPIMLIIGGKRADYKLTAYVLSHRGPRLLRSFTIEVVPTLTFG